jgi:mono/diheme cytochrome c family protein
MRRPRCLIGSGLLLVLVAVASLPDPRAAASQAQPANPDTWQIPLDAAGEKSPLAVDDKVLASGHEIFKAKCQRCHGPEGRGDGPDADMDHMPGDLTDSTRAEKNPDGILFYKVWNGRRKPKMPAFKTEMTREEVWTVVEYVKTLRK